MEDKYCSSCLFKIDTNMDKLKKIFSSILHISETAITDKLSPENTDTWDSLNAIVLLTEIEKGFGIVFDIDEAMSVKSFGDAVKLVSAKGVKL